MDLPLSFAFPVSYWHLTPEICRSQQAIDIECAPTGNSTGRSAVSSSFPTEVLDTSSGHLAQDPAFSALVQAAFDAMMDESRNDPQGSPSYPAPDWSLLGLPDHGAVDSSPQSTGNTMQPLIYPLDWDQFGDIRVASQSADESSWVHAGLSGDRIATSARDNTDLSADSGTDEQVILTPSSACMPPSDMSERASEPQITSPGHMETTSPSRSQVSQPESLEPQEPQGRPRSNTQETAPSTTALTNYTSSATSTNSLALSSPRPGASLAILHRQRSPQRVGGKLNEGQRYSQRVRGKLNEEQREKARVMRKVGNCLRCRAFKLAVSCPLPPPLPESLSLL